MNLLRYVDYVPRNIEFVFDLDSALKLSQIKDKPILIIFTGVGCKSTRDIDWKVVKTSDSEKLIRDNFIVAFLFVDIKGKLKEPVQIMYEGRPKIISTIGRYNWYLQIERYKSNAQPYYCIVDHNMVDLADPRGYDLDSAGFKDFLIQGLLEFRSNSLKLKSSLK